jgi:hypothetical protein
MQFDAATWEMLRRRAVASFMLDERGERLVHGSDQERARHLRQGQGLGA